MAESSYINSLANRPYRSTVKTLPATLPELWSLVRGPRLKDIGPWSTDLKPRIVGLGSGLLGLFAGSRSNWFEGWGRMLAGLAAQSSDGGLVQQNIKDSWGCVGQCRLKCERRILVSPRSRNNITHPSPRSGRPPWIEEDNLVGPPLPKL